MIENTYIKKSKSWSEFSSKINLLIENNKKLQAGKIYEKCVQLFLQTDPKYQAALKHVWLLQDVPKSIREKLKLPNADEGIDLIAETNQKSYWAIQAKYKSDKTSTLTRKDLSTFRDLAFNYCKNIEHGLVCSPISHEPKKSNLMNKMGFALINEWEDLDKDKNKGWKNIQKRLGGKAVKPEKFKPKPHQSKAIREVIKAFKNNSVERGKMIMPCGTGKSLTAFWITRDMKVKNVLVAIPSLSLLQQTLNVWTKEFLANDIQPDYLCVCSDESAGTLEKDEFTAQTYDLGIRTTTNVDEISSFLKNKNSKFKIIFTTYQSGQATAKASKKAKFSFDLGIMDEAHKTVGHKLKPMAHLLYEKNIKIKKRLFMTATERVYKGGKENEILSMDDSIDYGNTVYQMSYKEAIDAGVVADYKIVSFDVSNTELSEIIENNEFVRLNNNPKQNQDITSRELATALALRKIFKKYKISKVISFHSSIKRANKFEELNKEINSKFQKYTQIETFHVSSNQTTSKRTNEMRSFENSTQSIITNARCLTEGVDVPAIDCVAFIDSKKSKVDIVQAAGRAMRINKGKKFGYILVPIITNYGDIKSGSIDTEYEDLISVITSLATQDERLIDEIKTIQSGKKRKSKSKILNNLNILKYINPNEIDKNIKLKIWSKIASFSYLDYETTKKFAIKNNIKSNTGWRKLCLKKNFPIDITKHPDFTFKNKGWTNWGNFLNTKNLGYSKLSKNFYSYIEAKKITRKLGIVGTDQWKKYINSNKFDSRLPRMPFNYYKNDNFSWYDFLGAKSPHDKTGYNYTSYDKAKKFLKKFKFKSLREYQLFDKSNFPTYIPKNPERFQKDGSWKGWGDYLSTGNVPTNKKFQVLSFKNIINIVHKEKIKNQAEYRRIWKNKFEKYGISAKPYRAYSKDWKGWIHFLGPQSEDYSKKISYEKMKTYIKKFKLKNKSEYKNFFSKNNLRKKGFYGIDIEKKSFFISWVDFLGPQATTIKKLNYQEMKKVMKKRKFRFKNRIEYAEAYNKELKYLGFTLDPTNRGKNTSWDNFLDIK